MEWALNNAQDKGLAFFIAYLKRQIGSAAEEAYNGLVEASGWHSSILIYKAVGHADDAGLLFLHCDSIFALQPAKDNKVSICCFVLGSIKSSLAQHVHMCMQNLESYAVFSVSGTGNVGNSMPLQVHWHSLILHFAALECYQVTM